MRGKRDDDVGEGSFLIVFMALTLAVETGGSEDSGNDIANHASADQSGRWSIKASRSMIQHGLCISLEFTQALWGSCNIF